MVNASSIKNLHEKRNGLAGAGSAQASLSIRRVGPNGNFRIKFGPNGKPIFNRPRHILSCSSSESEESIEQDDDDEERTAETEYQQ